jgi:hypothetical protein
MARDEADMLPRWLRYYGEQLGVENLTVLDDNSSDGSTDDLRCTVLRLPPAPWKQSFEPTRMKLANGMAQTLLSVYDAVVFTDVDEFLVADPARYDGLRHFLSTRSDVPIIAPVGLNLLHHPAVEPDLDSTVPVLSQRRFVKFVGGMCKPAIKRVNAPWAFSSHGIGGFYEPDRELLMLHLKFFDAASLGKVSAHRQVLHAEHGRGGKNSTWQLGADELTSQLRTWVDTPDPETVPVFDPAELELRGVVRKKEKGFYRSSGGQLAAMEESPLRRLHPRFREAL